MNIESMLLQYREQKALLCFKERDIEALQKQLEYNNQVFIENDKETIEGISMSAAQLSHIGKSHTNKFNSTTENAMLNYIKDRYHKNDFNEDVIDIKRKIRELEIASEPHKKIVDDVDIAMKVLDAKEKFVIIRKYFRGYTIPETVTFFAKNYGYGSERTIIRICEEAIQKMDNILEIKSA